MSVPYGAPERLPLFDLTVVTTIKNEAPYLAEWLEYHGLLGVQHFYIFDNGSTDDPASVLRPYIVQGRVTLINWPAYPGQDSAYNFAIKSFGHHNRWMALIDVDEFFQLSYRDTLPRLLADLPPDADQLLVPWMMFGSSGHEQKPEGLVTSNFVHRAESCGPQVKCIVRPEAVIWAEIHNCVTRSGKAVNGEGAPIPVSWSVPAAACDAIRLNHYFIKSRAEWSAKIARGQAGGGTGKKVDQFDRFDVHVPDSSMRRFADSIEAAMARTHSRPTPRGYAPWSSYSELAPVRAWHVAARAAFDRIRADATPEQPFASSIGLEQAVLSGAGQAAFETMVDEVTSRLPGCSVGPAVSVSQEGSADAGLERLPFGRQFLFWRNEGGEGAAVVVIQGTDPSGRAYSHETCIDMPSDASGMAMLAPRTLQPATLSIRRANQSSAVALTCLPASFL